MARRTSTLAATALAITGTVAVLALTATGAIALLISEAFSSLGDAGCGGCAYNGPLTPSTMVVIVLGVVCSGFTYWAIFRAMRPERKRIMAMSRRKRG